MQKLKKYALYGIPILIGAYLIYRQFKKPTQISTRIIQPPENIPSTQSGGSSSSGSTSTTNKCTYPISKNYSVCDDIKDVQFYLNNIMSASEINEVQKWFSVKDDFSFFQTSWGTIIGCNTVCNKKPLVIDGKLGDKTIALWNDTLFNVAEQDSFTKEDVNELKDFYNKFYNIQQAIDNPLVSTPSPANPKVGSVNYLANQPRLGGYSTF